MHFTNATNARINFPKCGILPYKCHECTNKFSEMWDNMLRLSFRKTFEHWWRKKHKTRLEKHSSIRGEKLQLLFFHKS